MGGARAVVVEGVVTGEAVGRAENCDELMAEKSNYNASVIPSTECR